MLLKNSTGIKFSWAINWYAVNFLTNKYTLYPLFSFAQHIGASVNATNYLFIGTHDPLEVNLTLNNLKLCEVPVTELKEVAQAYNKFLILYNK